MAQPHKTPLSSNKTVINMVGDFLGGRDRVMYAQTNRHIGKHTMESNAKHRQACFDQKQCPTGDTIFGPCFTLCMSQARYIQAWREKARNVMEAAVQRARAKGSTLQRMGIMLELKNDRDEVLHLYTHYNAYVDQVQEQLVGEMRDEEYGSYSVQLEVKVWTVKIADADAIMQDIVDAAGLASLQGSYDRTENFRGQSWSFFTYHSVMQLNVS